MKFIIRQLLIAVTLISIIYECQCKRNQIKTRLSRVFDEIKAKRNIKYSNEIDNEIGSAYDMDCVKSFLKLPQNNKMIVTEVEEMVVMVAAAMQCSDDNKVFESQVRQYVHSGTEKIMNCARQHLKQLEPTSKLFENFEISETELEKCKETFKTQQIVNLQNRLERVLGPLNVWTCGAVSENPANDFLKFLGKGAVIRYANISEELRKTETEALKEYFKDVSAKTVNCIIKRYENDPAAQYINDTLNYYFQKELVQIDPNQEDPINYYKHLIKVEGTIDYDCVKEKLNLPEFGDKLLLEVEATILIAAAKSKCIRVDPLEFADLFIKFAIEEGQVYHKHFTCARYKLQKLEPTSKLSVMTSNNKTDEDDCKYRSITLHPYSNPAWSYKDVVGRFNETTCGVLTNEILDVITLKTTLLFDEKDKDVKNSETKELFKYATGKLHKLADCVLERIK